MDTLSIKERSERMSRVLAKDTKPEMLVRRLIHAMGYRYRLHYRNLPGNPDMVFPARKKVIFIHGCFWHRHPKCKNTRFPKSRLDFWKPKLLGNARRDKTNQKKLQKIGWKYMIIWECQLRNIKAIERDIRKYLGAH